MGSGWLLNLAKVISNQPTDIAAKLYDDPLKNIKNTMQNVNLGNFG